MKRIKAAIQRWLNRLWGATRIPKAIDHATQWAVDRRWFVFASFIKIAPVLLLNAVGLWGLVKVAMHADSNLVVFAKVLSAISLCALTAVELMHSYGSVRASSRKTRSESVSEE
ncbi:hypothetical protein [Ralstonia flatus]|uniref:hypothetical protein n=1 Tax=Ralstonia flatus TaxID=3058601 RepID=UPI0019D2C6FB|nr:hypothetical protein [Ralstonia sp. LMG 32965]MBN6211459.1 hypothetical protein [Ralstonia pickettii]